MFKPLAAFVLLTFMFATVVEASRPNDVVHDYFSDPQLDHWVGEVEYTCGGGIIFQGKRTAYEKHTSDSCSVRKVGIARMSSIPASTSKLNRITICRNYCSRKFGGPHLCTLDGCPDAEALAECNTDCEVNDK